MNEQFALFIIFLISPFLRERNWLFVFVHLICFLCCACLFFSNSPPQRSQPTQSGDFPPSLPSLPVAPRPVTQPPLVEGEEVLDTIVAVVCVEFCRDPNHRHGSTVLSSTTTSLGESTEEDGSIPGGKLLVTNFRLLFCPVRIPPSLFSSSLPLGRSVDDSHLSPPRHSPQANYWYLFILVFRVRAS